MIVMLPRTTLRLDDMGGPTDDFIVQPESELRIRDDASAALFVLRVLDHLVPAGFHVLHESKRYHQIVRQLRDRNLTRLQGTPEAHFLAFAQRDYAAHMLLLTGVYRETIA